MLKPVVSAVKRYISPTAVTLPGTVMLGHDAEGVDVVPVPVATKRSSFAPLGVVVVHEILVHVGAPPPSP